MDRLMLVRLVRDLGGELQCLVGGAPPPGADGRPCAPGTGL